MCRGHPGLRPNGAAAKILIASPGLSIAAVLSHHRDVGLLGVSNLLLPKKTQSWGSLTSSGASSQGQQQRGQKEVLALRNSILVYEVCCAAVLVTFNIS